MKRAKLVFLVAMVLGMGSGTLFGGEQDAAGVQMLGHVGLGVSDLQRALHFYTYQLGLKEAFRLKRPDGSPFLLYLRVDDSNFVELFPGGTKQMQAQAPGIGIYHLGLFVKDLQATLRTLQGRGYPLPADAFVKAAKVQADGTLLYFLKDPDGNNIELSQITPESLQAKSGFQPRRPESGVKRQKAPARNQ
jgi:lactoylglutathione lyase